MVDQYSIYWRPRSVMLYEISSLVYHLTQINFKDIKNSKCCVM